MTISKLSTGILLAAAAGCFWGTMAVSGQYMIQKCGFGPEELTTLRLGGAGVFMLFLGFLSDPKIFRSLKDLSICKDVFIYGICLFLIQYTFFLSINASNAGTAAIMVGFGPIVLILWNFFYHRQKVLTKELIALFFAVFGVILLVTKGDFSGLTFSVGGVFWGLASATFGAIATVQPRKAIEKIGVTKVVTFGMCVGGVLMCLISPPWKISGSWTVISAIAAFFMVVFGTVAAFWCYLRSTEFIPAALTSILASFEPLSAVLLCVVFLGTSFNEFESLGAALIISNLFLLSIPEERIKKNFSIYIRKLNTEKSEP